jgi:hypothetical protein
MGLVMHARVSDSQTVQLWRFSDEKTKQKQVIPSENLRMFILLPTVTK